MATSVDAWFEPGSARQRAKAHVTLGFQQGAVMHDPHGLLRGEGMQMRHVTFAAGRNIAMKVPPHVYDATVRFYREVLGLPEIAAHAPSVVFEFGSVRLWIDRVPGISQAETRLEVVTNALEAASALLAEAGVVRCDDIEPLPPGFRGFWVSSPASIDHLVCEGWAAGGSGPQAGGNGGTPQGGR